MRRVPLSEIKGDLSRFLREAEARRSSSLATVNQRVCLSTSDPRKTGLIISSKMIRAFCAASTGRATACGRARGVRIEDVE